ncbi:MAG: TolC family protein [Tannerella sp.]|jgi:outer membrane protein TolC|nr:TolC family protein [Tannerella sp.]
MKRYFFIIIALFACAQLSRAQQKLSLADAMEYAAKNRYDAQADRIDVNLAENAVGKSRNEWIPEITAGGEVLYNAKLQTMIFDTGEEFQMGTRNLTTLGIELNQPVFKPGLSTGIKISKAALSVRKEALREKENDIKMYVVEAYLNVILREQQLKLSEESTERHKSYFDLARDKMQLGTILESELLQARTDYENAQTDLQKARQNYGLAMKKLKYQLNLPDAEKLVLTDSLPALLKNSPVQARDANIEDRPELRQLYFSQQENDLRLKKSDMMWLPTVSLIANYTTEFQASNFNYSQQFWFPYNYVGLKASFPLSNIFKLRTDRREYKLKSSQLAMQYSQQQHDINYEVDKCNTELLNAVGNINSTGKTLDLSKELYLQQLAIYKLGTVTYSALLDAESSVNTARQNYISAVYDYLIAFYNCKKTGVF